jgi:hypothetical protein
MLAVLASGESYERGRAKPFILRQAVQKETGPFGPVSLRIDL